MFKLDNGMVVRFYDGDIGIVLDSYIICNDSYVKINDDSLWLMFEDTIHNACAIEVVYRPDNLHTINKLLDVNSYTEDDIIWERNKTFTEGVAYYFGTEEVAKKYNVYKYGTYLYANGKLTELDGRVIPYLDVEVVNVE